MPLQGSGGPFELRAGNPKRKTTKGLTGFILSLFLSEWRPRSAYADRGPWERWNVVTGESAGRLARLWQ